MLTVQFLFSGWKYAIASILSIFHILDQMSKIILPGAYDTLLKGGNVVELFGKQAIWISLFSWIDFERTSIAKSLSYVFEL